MVDLQALKLRPKRPDQGIWKWTNRIYIPCPLRVKNEFMRVARANDMSQAELGLVLIQAAMEESELTQEIIDEYRRLGKEYNRDLVEKAGVRSPGSQ